MPPSPTSEENHPLLLLLLEDGSPRKKNRFAMDNKYSRVKDRSEKLLFRWSAPVTCSFCLFICVCLIYGVLLPFIYTMQSMHSVTGLPICIPRELQKNDTTIYLVHRGTWRAMELISIERIIKKYPGIPIEIITLENKTNPVKRSTPAEPAIRKRPNKTRLDKLLAKYPIISSRTENMVDYFEPTPLRKTWMNLNYNLMEFAARAVKLWEFGGISFKLQKRMTFRDVGPMHEAAIKTNISFYNSLPTKVVNIDDDGCDMETKTTCHAFFHEIIAKLRLANLTTSVKNVVVDTFKKFCSSGAIKDAYCSHILSS